MKLSYTNIVVFSSIFGIFLLSWIAPPIIAILISFSFFFFLFFKKRKLNIDPIGLLIIFNFVYWIVSGFITGSIDIFSFANLKFYDGDARAFLAYAPLLFFCVATVNLENIKFVVKAFQWLALISILLFLVWFPTQSPFLGVNDGRLFTGFITSHTAAGTYYGAVSIILFFCGYIAKQRFYLISALVMILVVFGTASRATLLGIGVVTIWYVFSNFKVKNVAFIVTLGCLFVLSMPLIASGTFERIFPLLNWDTIALIQHQIALGAQSWQPGDSDIELAGGDANIMSRIVIWAYALNKFIQSPLVGIGWGRFNDTDISLFGIPGLIDLALRGEQHFNESSAHNSYFMLLCESGLVGLWLLMKVWVGLYQRLARAKRDYAHQPFLLGYYTGCQALILFTMTAALFGHTLAAPANCIPVLTVVGAGIGYHRTERLSKLDRRLAQRDTANATLTDGIADNFSGD